MIDRDQLERALPAIAESGLPLLVHAELTDPIDAAFEKLHDADWRKYATYQASRPDEAELQAIDMMLELCSQYKFRLHIVHLSTACALPVLRAAKAEGLPVTIETCPHYLHFAAEEIADGNTLAKCAPPIRSAENREALWEGLRDGTIDLIATDHSPCPPEMKRLEQGRFDLAWGGIASLSVALPVVWTETERRGLTVEDVVRWMSAGPARLAGMSDRAGAIAVGRDANFVVFDPDAQFEVTPDRLYFRHAVSPYVGARLRGSVEATYLRGESVWRSGEFDSRRRGRELRLS
jgi:allantoinase